MPILWILPRTEEHSRSIVDYYGGTREADVFGEYKYETEIPPIWMSAGISAEDNFYERPESRLKSFPMKWNLVHRNEIWEIKRIGAIVFPSGHNRPELSDF